MRLKTVLAIVMFLLLIGGVSFYSFVDGLSQRRPDVIELSPSRQYVVERVPFRVLFVDSGLSYLRITDQDAPKYIYRSPLYPTELLTMHVNENGDSLTVSDVVFLRKEKKFIFHVENWKEYALNRFVSNTPYAAESLVEGNKQ